MVFYPQADSLKLITTAEDFVIRVWDLVMKKEVAILKPKGADNMAHMTTSLVFTNDKKTLITGGRDSCIHFWDASDNFKLISTVNIDQLGALKFEEINSLLYLSAQDNFTKDDPCLVIGGSSGQISIYSIKRQSIVFAADESRRLGLNWTGKSQSVAEEG
jgi:WD40 repeat protein